MQAHRTGVLPFEERRSDQRALPAQSGLPWGGIAAVGEAVWALEYMCEALIALHGKGV